MADILMRDDAPLSAEQWQQVDATVRETVGQVLIGRRMLDLYGPLGFGAYTVPLYAYSRDETTPVRAEIKRQLPMVTLMKKFIIAVKDLELMNAGQPFDIGPIATAATNMALAEDRLIFHGDEEEGVAGLLTTEGRTTLPLSDWDDEGQALADISAATAELVSAGFYGPYFVAMHPTRASKLHRVHGKRGILEIELLERQAQGGVFTSPVMPKDQVILLAGQATYVDLAIGMDTSVGFIETADLEHLFRLMETLALRIKQPGAICTLA